MSGFCISHKGNLERVRKCDDIAIQKQVTVFSFSGLSIEREKDVVPRIDQTKKPSSSVTKVDHCFPSMSLILLTCPNIRPHRCIKHFKPQPQ